MRVQSSGGELIETLPGSRDAFEELHVHLETEAGLRLLVPLPALRVRAMLLIGRQPAHPVSAQNAMHRRRCDGEAVKALQVGRNPGGAEVIALPEVQNLADDLAPCRPGRAVRRPSPIVQTGLAVGFVAPFLLVEGLPGNPEMAAGASHVTRALARVLQHFEPPRLQPGDVPVAVDI